VAKSIDTLSACLGYGIKTPACFERALTHRSASADNNERLEFLGDAILGAVVGHWLYERFPEATEGELTRIRSSLVKGSTLAKVARDIGLDDFIRLGAGEKKAGGRGRESILSDALEAVIAAIFLESDLDTCRERILAWYGDRLQLQRLSSDEKDAKTRLQELLQQRGLELPVYQVVCTEGAPHNQTFTVSCQVPSLDNPVSAKASSRKKAEKKAAELALNLLMR
jgi:ribonuclease-3